MKFILTVFLSISLMTIAKAENIPTNSIDMGSNSMIRLNNKSFDPIDINYCAIHMQYDSNLERLSMSLVPRRDQSGNYVDCSKNGLTDIFNNCEGSSCKSEIIDKGNDGKFRKYVTTIQVINQDVLFTEEGYDLDNGDLVNVSSNKFVLRK